MDGSYTKEIISLTKQKEDEVTWSKTDTLFGRITEELNTKEDIEKILPGLKELLLRSILSDRSKLSGTSLTLLKKIVEVSKGELQYLSEILPVLIKICGRSNRIVLKRGQDAIVHLCKYVDLSPYAKTFSEYSSSTNKNVRLGIFRALEASFSDKEIPRAFEKIIIKGKEDPFNEVRMIAKGLLEGKAITEEPVKERVVKSNPMFGTRVMNQSIVSNSPLRKIFKVEKKVDTENEKIKVLEQKVRTIIKPNKTKVQKIVEAYNTRDLLSAIPKKEKEKHDDLTPKKLDKFLSKYRNVYGNVLEGKEEVAKSDKEAISKDNEGSVSRNNEESISVNVENKEEESISRETVNAKDKEEFTISSEQMIVANNEQNEALESISKDETPMTTTVNEVDVLEGYEESLASNNKEETVDFLLENYQNEAPLENIEKDFGNLSIVEDEPISSCGRFNFTIVNSEQTEMTKIEEEEVRLPKPCPPVTENRFSPLLYADKDECVIFDINKEDPKFKTPCNAAVKDSAFTSPMDVPVVNNTLSSSFLYSKNEESPEDFTQINSFIYADKKTFSRTPK